MAVWQTFLQNGVAVKTADSDGVYPFTQFQKH